MQRFEIGEIAIFVGNKVVGQSEVEIISEEYRYKAKTGYDIIYPGLVCRARNSKAGEFFCATRLLRKKPKRKYDGYDKASWKDSPWIPDDILNDIPILDIEE